MLDRDLPVPELPLVHGDVAEPLFGPSASQEQNRESQLGVYCAWWYRVDSYALRQIL
jgi:hypothetical protein